MFTGLIEHLGQVDSVHHRDNGAVLWVDPRGWAHRPAPGDSIAVNGCCLTLVAADPHFRFDLVHQTLKSTTLGRLGPGDTVNLEHAATPATLLGGHIVQGHIDGVGLARSAGSPPDPRLRVETPDDLLDFIVPKGSIAIDGVSLTIATVGDGWFEVALIPTTLEKTNLSRVGQEPVQVNLETDCLVKAVVNYLRRRGSTAD